MKKKTACKKNLLRALCGLVFVLVLAAMLLLLDEALKLRHRDGLNPDFYDFPGDTFDVVFLGSSVLKFGLLPMELYGEYGIASYNLSTGNQSPGISYYLAKEAIEKDHPDLIVLECGRAFFEEEPKEAPYIHYVTDSMPYYSPNRTDLILDLAQKEDRKSLLFPLIEYHSRWQELTGENDGIRTDQKLYGARVIGHRSSCVPFEEPEIIPDYISGSSLEYIEKTIELCRENSTDLLLLSMPILGENGFFDQRGYNYRASVAYELGQIAKERGLLYADFFGKQDELGLDPETDAYDGEHLNRWGAEKFTRQLGAFLKEHYDLPDLRGAGGKYSAVRKDFERYPANRMKASLQSAHTLADYAAILAVDAKEDPVEDALVLVAMGGTAKEGKIREEDDALLKRFGITQDLSSWQGHGWIAVIDGGRTVYETALPEKGGPQGQEGEGRDQADHYEGSSGKLSFSVSSGLTQEGDDSVRDGISFVVNGQHYELPEYGLQFAVFEKSTGELMDACRMKRENKTMRCSRDSN